MERDTYFGDRVLATHRPRALASTPYWRLASLVFGASSVAAGLFAWVLTSVLSVSATGMFMYCGWGGLLAVACWQGPKIWLEGVRYYVTEQRVVVCRGLYRRSIERSAINYARIIWDRSRSNVGTLELVRAVPAGPLRRRLTLRLSGLEAPDRVLAVVRGTTAPQPAGLSSLPLAQRLDVGERVLWSARRRSSWRDFIPQSRREWMIASMAVALIGLSSALTAQSVQFAVHLSEAGLETQWVAIVLGATSTSVIVLLTIAAYLIHQVILSPGLLSRNTRYLVTNDRILIQRGREEMYVDRSQVVDAIDRQHGRSSDLVLVLSGLRSVARTVARRLDTEALIPILEAVDDLEGLRQALALRPAHA